MGHEETVESKWSGLGIGMCVKLIWGVSSGLLIPTEILDYLTTSILTISKSALQILFSSTTKLSFSTQNLLLFRFHSNTTSKAHVILPIKSEPSPTVSTPKREISLPPQQTPSVTVDIQPTPPSPRRSPRKRYVSYLY